MNRIRFAPTALFAILFLLPISAGSDTPPKTHIPPIAHIAGFTVGILTIAQMSKRFGRPHTFAGFHPDSENDWDLPRAGLQVEANFDDLTDHGQPLTDGIIISAEDKRGKDRSLGFMGLVLPGMSRSEVLRLLRGRLPAPAVSKNELTWVMRGSATVHYDNGNNPLAPYVKSGSARISYTVWTAEIDFTHGRVDNIAVTCQ